MNAPATSLMPIFAAPFGVVPITAAAELNPDLAVLFAARAMTHYREPAAPPDPLCFRSREDLLEWPEPAVSQLGRAIMAGVSEVVIAANQYSAAERETLGVQARVRFVIVRPDGHLSGATAPMASWCAVYCVAAPAPTPARMDSAVLRLYAVRHPSMFLDASNYRMRIPFSADHHVWRPVPGQMAVFPASIPHEVALNRTHADLILVIARLRFADQGVAGAVPPW